MLEDAIKSNSIYRIKTTILQFKAMIILSFKILDLSRFNCLFNKLIHSMLSLIPFTFTEPRKTCKWSIYYFPNE